MAYAFQCDTRQTWHHIVCANITPNLYKALSEDVDDHLLFRCSGCKMNLSSGYGTATSASAPPMSPGTAAPRRVHSATRPTTKEGSHADEDGTQSAKHPRRTDSQPSLRPKKTTYASVLAAPHSSTTVTGRLVRPLKLTQMGGSMPIMACAGDPGNPRRLIVGWRISTHTHAHICVHALTNSPLKCRN